MPADSIYMGKPVELTQLPNGALANAESVAKLHRTMYTEPVIDPVAPGVFVIGGDGWVNYTVIDAPQGLIVYDTGETIEDGVLLRKRIRSFSDKPIKAVIYSHSHYVHGTLPLIEGEEGVQIIGHPNVNKNLADGATGVVHAETAPIQVSRLLQQFARYTDETGPNACAGARINFGRSGLLPVDTPVQDGERMEVAGVELVFYTRHGSDSDDCLTVHIPHVGVVLNNFLWPFMPNIYTLRAAKFRDPRDWRDGLLQIRALQPQALTGTHARTIKGRAEVRDALDHVIDSLNFVLDQTLRGILRGLGPEQLRSFVRLPPALAAHPNLAEIYGEVSHFGPYLHHHALGWFDGDAASANPLPPDEQADRLVRAMGGHAAVLAASQRALEDREWAWAAQLAQYLYILDPLDPEARAVKARALEEMGRVTPAHTVRNWYMSQARALRGEVDIPILQFTSIQVLALAPPHSTVDQFRVRIDPTKAGDAETSLALRFKDNDAVHGWRVRRGVAAFVRDPGAEGADLEVTCSLEDWLRYFTCRMDLEGFLASCQAVTGSMEQIGAFFGMFDQYPPANNHLIPALPERP